MLCMAGLTEAVWITHGGKTGTFVDDTTIYVLLRVIIN